MHAPRLTSFESLCHQLILFSSTDALTTHDDKPLIVPNSTDINPADKKTIKVMLRYFKQHISPESFLLSKDALSHLIRHYESIGQVQASAQLAKRIESVHAHYLFKEALKSNDPEKLYELGEKFFFGKEIKQNIPKAIHLLKTALEQGNLKAIKLLEIAANDKKDEYAALNLARFFLKRDLQDDQSKVFKYLSLAADCGNKWALHYLSINYPNRYQTMLAKTHLEEAAQKGDPKAQFALAYMLFQTQDFEKGIHYLHLAAESKLPEALFSLGQLYCADEHQHVQKDYPKGIAFLLESAQMNYAHAQYALAYHYYDGDGVEKSLELCMQYLELGAKQNHGDSLYFLGSLYEEGVEISQNLEWARAYYEKSAAQNCSEGQFSLALCYARGTGGESNFQKAFEYFEKAAFNNHHEAQIQMVACLISGQGTVANPAKAFTYLNRFASEGNTKAIYFRDNFKNMQEIAIKKNQIE